MAAPLALRSDSVVQDLEAALRPAWVDVDLSALEHNLAEIRGRLRGSSPSGKAAATMAVVKADAYGHGAPGVARTLAEAGVDWLGRGAAGGGSRDPPRRRGGAHPGAGHGAAGKDRPLRPLPAYSHHLFHGRARPVAGLDSRAVRGSARPSQGGHRHGPPRRGPGRGAPRRWRSSAAIPASGSPACFPTSATRTTWRAPATPSRQSASRPCSPCSRRKSGSGR